MVPMVPAVPSTYVEAVQLLHLLLARNAVILFLDGLESLADLHNARSTVSFLRDLRPHPDTLIVVSATADEKPSSLLAVTVLGMHTEYQRQMEVRKHGEARKRDQEEEEVLNESHMISRLVNLLT